ncbi:MAG: aminopeptidase P family N-terminal domain-containing protein [Lachnospiraceae bacterium]|nr:aminopeptidase P family N-terminal domain-containing protein [Lachnospiraceae bacterium]
MDNQNKNNHIKELRIEMERRGVKYFTAVTSDAHDSEYICEHDNAVKYISGFTGTNGRLAVTADDARLWTDGRYFIQADDELQGSGITLMKTGEPGVPGYKEWCESAGIDPTARIIRENDDAGRNTAQAGNADSDAPDREKASDDIAKRKACDDSLYELIIDIIWPDRPARPANPLWIHDIRWAGRTAREKTELVRQVMQERGLKEIFINALDDIAWLLNLRGSDIPYNPVFYSFLHIADTITIYLQPASLSPQIEEYLKNLNIKIADYADFADSDANRNRLAEGQPFSTVVADIKTHKSADELQHMRECGLRDGVYMTKFIYWIKKRMQEASDFPDEINASDHLDALRAGDPYYVSLSFPTISAYGPDAAIVHYEAKQESCRTLKPQGLYLVDCGGQYLDGTTDVTRTIALGPLTEEEKTHYTLVCIGMLRVLNRKFTLPLNSSIIDECAREMLRANELDFNHGAGHGIGFLGYVHEGPARISRSQNKEQKQTLKSPQQSASKAVNTVPVYKFTGNEITSDEPGVYIEGSHGVRIENLIAVGDREFECLTWVPLETEAIDFSLMTEEDKNNFENYQAEVKTRISPFLTDDERRWLNEI